MSLTLNILVVIAMIALVIILGTGLWSMFKGGGRLSQNLMRARVIVQFVAVLLLIALAFVMANSG